MQIGKKDLIWPDHLEHIGVKRESGRYEYGSGLNPYQHEAYFPGWVSKLRKEHPEWKDSDLAKACHMSIREFHKKISHDSRVKAEENYAKCKELERKGKNPTEISRELDIPRSTVVNILKGTRKKSAEEVSQTADDLKKYIDNGKIIDIGPGTERYLGITKNRLDNAVADLQKKGYTVNLVRMEQLGVANPNQKTTVSVLCPPGWTAKDVYNNLDKFDSINRVHNTDTGETRIDNKREYKSIDSNRIDILYAEDGGADKDGVIEIRRGVKDLELGKNMYGQVRIMVDNSHYLKGMAMYSDDLPDGVDIRFNTNKKKSVPKMDVLKPLNTNKDGTVNEEDPFKTTTKRLEYIDIDGETKTSAINFVREEGEWDTWSKTLASQFLSKQTSQLAKDQLKVTYDIKKTELENIMKVTQPTIKKQLLEEFADGCEASAADLKATKMPGQSTAVILPIPELNDNEVFNPRYPTGTKLALIRYPHAGRFEIADVVVNNDHPQAKSRLSGSQDAIGISPTTAHKLSGADFDGDTVVCIPNNDGRVISKNILKGLENFEPKDYKNPPDVTPVKDTKFNKGMQMGSISNLITDMTLAGASDDELERAVRHSMVIIDAQKHNLNWQQSYQDNKIAELKEKYQGNANAGASSLISRAHKGVQVPVKGKYYDYDPETGEKVYSEAKDSDKYRTIYKYKEGKAKAIEVYYRKKDDKYFYKTDSGDYVTLTDDQAKHVTSKTVERTEEVPMMSTVDDARKLMSNNGKGTQMEMIYANYANQMKALASEARKEFLIVRETEKDPGAVKTYAAEIDSLMEKLRIADSNAPMERLAQVTANMVVKQAKKDNPNMEYNELKKLKGRALTRARENVGANKTRIEFTDREWEAIQAGAFSKTMLKRILNASTSDAVKQMSMPKETVKVPQSRINRIMAMYRQGFEQNEIAELLGYSTSTINRIVREERSK